MKKIVYLFALLFFTHISFAQLSPMVDSIPMTDGKKLAADIYIPAGMSSGPVILVQTPYNRLLYRFAGLPLQIGMNVDSSKYIFIIADWRGFYGSSSAAYSGNPGHGEDGYDVVEWIAQQSWSNQMIGTWGASALGRVQFMTAKKNPPHLTCICPLVAGPQYDYVEYYPGGDLRTEYLEQLDGLGFGLSPVVMMHPVHDIAWTISENANFYPDSINVPCFMIGGWYDHTIQFMLEFYNGLRTQSPIAVRDKHRLMMGPWVHGGIGKLIQGELTYPDGLHWSDSLALMYFDFHLRSISNGWDVSPFVQYFQMGDNFWHSDIAWSSASNTNFYFHTDKTLDDTPPVDSTGSLSFNYDPNDPSPTIGGPTLRMDLEQGPYDQRDSVESRNDVLVFSTNVLTQDLILKGNAKVHLKISSDKTDTDFDVRLTDVYPDGRSMLVNDAALRMRFRNGFTANDTAAMVPGQIYDCVIELPATAITFLTGHKLRIDVSSSNYPRFNRNMNTGGPMYPGNSLDTLVSPEIATNTVYTNALQISYVELPLINYLTGIDESQKNNNDLRIFPNPFHDKLNVEMNVDGKYFLKMFNSTGQLILEKTFFSKTELNVSGIPAGIYYLDVEDSKSNKKYYQKIESVSNH
jgi:predicted acyl esterase